MFFLAAGLYLLWEVSVGWRRGVVRSAVYFGAVVVSGFAGVIAGQAVASAWGRVLPGSAFLAGLVAGAFVVVLVMVTCIVVGALLFKRTAQQSSAFVRLLFGAGGAFFGLLLGLAVLWGAISIVRVTGAMAETTIADRPSTASSSILRAFAKLKESIELGEAGRMVESVDVLPPATYKMIGQVGALGSDRDAMVRFLDYPGVQELLQNPRMARLLEDPSVLQASQSGNFLALMSNKSLLEAAGDPALMKLLQSFDLQKALDYAVPSAEASPTPKKKNP